MKVEYKIGVPTAYFEVMAGECFYFQGDFYLKCENGAVFLDSGKYCKSFTDAAPVFRVNAKIVIE